MKMIFALLISIALLMTSYAFAEQPVFLLKNGLQWGLTENDIYGLIGEEGAWSDTLFDGVDMMQYILDTDMGSGTVSLSMVLVDGELALIMYDLMGMDDPALKADIVSELSAAYGEPVDGGMDRYMASLCLLAGESLTAEDLGAPGTGCSWELSDGTYMGVYDMSDISFSVCFVNEPRFAVVGEYAAAVPSVPFTAEAELIYDATSGETSMPDFPEFATLIPELWPLSYDEAINASGIAGYMESEYAPGIMSVYCESFDDIGMASVDYIFDAEGKPMVQRYAYMAFSGQPAVDLEAELTALYGEPVVTDADTLYSILIATGLDQPASPEEMLSTGINGNTTWFLEDGSFIFLISNDGRFKVNCISPEIVSAAK